MRETGARRPKRKSSAEALRGDKTVLDLLEGVLAGNFRAVARAISLVENNHPRAQSLMKELFPRRTESLILGVTGAPGSGKSTLADGMIGHLREEGYPVGVVAVDPSSPFSGGAILGDRIRMMRHTMDKQVFIRSMATRGHLGGLAKATGEAILIFESAGKKVILVETVGVGQDEVEVVKLADIIIVVLTPGAGDDIQAFKAGLMEIADVFVINKADQPDTDRMERQLRAMLELGVKEKEIPPVVRTVATKGEGVDQLMKTIWDLRLRRDSAALELRKKRLITWMFRDIIHDKIDSLLDSRLSRAEFDDIVAKIFRRELDPYTAAEAVVSKILESGGREGKRQ